MDTPTYDSWKLRSPDFDQPDELPERFYDMAEEKIEADSELLYATFDNSVWTRDYLAELFRVNKHFREEVLGRVDIYELALGLYHLEAPSDAECED